MDYLPLYQRDHGHSTTYGEGSDLGKYDEQFPIHDAKIENFFKKFAEKFGGLKKRPYICSPFEKNGYQMKVL